MRLTHWIVGLLTSWALGPAPALAQPADPHAALPERPSVATHAATVAPGWLEIEAGWERTRDNGRFGDAGLPLAVKLGLTPRSQLTIATSVSRPSAGASVADVSIGVKWRLTDSAPVAGAVAVLPSLNVSTGSADATGETAAGLLLIASRTLGAVSLDLNVGYTRRTGDGSRAPKTEALWAASLGGPLSRRVSWLGEVYGYPATAGPAGESAIVGSIVGASAAISSSIVVDIALALPVAGPESHAVLAGVVWNAGSVWRRRPRVP
jgi:hypothetical protein